MPGLGQFHLGYGVRKWRDKPWRQMIAILLLIWPGFSAMAEPVRIVALGDSLVHGYGLDPDEGFVSQMQDWLDQAGVEVDLVNAGLSGDTTSGGLARLDWALGDDADALIVSLGGNDILRAMSPALARANIAEILGRAKDRNLPVLLIGIVVPPNYGAAYQAEFEEIYPSLANDFDALFYPDFLGVFTQSGDRAANYQQWFQPDGLHPNASGVARIVDNMGPFVKDLALRAGG